MFLYFLFFYILLSISSIKTCPLKTVDIQSGCYCGIEIDGTNYIHCHPYTINKIPEFTRSYIYDKLNLSENLIENLNNKSLLQLKVKSIYIENNPLKFIDKQSFNHNLLHYLEELSLETINNHNIEFLCYGQWKKLRILKLSGFNFNQYQYCLNKFYRLEKLIIQNSDIKLITHHIYKLPFLYELSLINNNIEYLNFDDEDLTYSSSIRILNLTSNHLRTIPDDLNVRLPHLITLDLSQNLIETIPLINQITTLNINLSSNLINYVQLNENQHSIDLSSNPICTLEKQTDEIFNVIMNNLTNLHCDCRLASLFIRTNLTEQVLKLFGEQTKCTTPENLQGRFVKDLTYEQLMNSCSEDLPTYCKEITNFKQIQQELNSQSITQVIETAEKLNDNQNQFPSFRLTSFSTHYENNDLLIYWDFDTSSSLIHLLTTKFQIIIEQEIASKTEIIRRTDFLSPHLKQYIIPHLPTNKNYYVCLLFTRTSYGIDKYCRETKALSNPTFLPVLFQNRSTILGFIVGIILTTTVLLTLAFICHLRSKQKDSHSIYDHRQQQQQQRYMYVSRNEMDGTYSHSILSSSSSKYHHLKKPTRRRTYLTPIPPWYHHNTRPLLANPRTPCCFLQYHNRTLSSSTTTNRITSLSSEYSTGIDKEQMTSTSLISHTSLDEQPNSAPIQSPTTKHVYEELGDTNLFL